MTLAAPTSTRHLDKNPAPEFSARRVRSRLFFAGGGENENNGKCGPTFYTTPFCSRKKKIMKGTHRAYSGYSMAIPPLTRKEFATPKGRRRAWRALMLGDHGVLRKLYDNSHEVVPGKMWRTYQPSPAMIKDWADRGIKTMINLRGDKPSGFLFLEEEACAKHGIELVTFRVFSRDAPSKEILHGARDLFARIAYPAVMHCKSGADRAGLMSTLFLFLHEGWPIDKALGHLSFRYGHVSAGKTGVIDAAFNQYLDYAKHNEIAFDDVSKFFEWVEETYDPVATKNDFKPTSLGNFLTETILRRE